MRHYKRNALDLKCQNFCDSPSPVSIIVSTHHIQIAQKTNLIQQRFLRHIPSMQDTVTAFQDFQYLRPQKVMRI